MALDIIKNIVEAEAKADEMIKNAEAEAASLKAEAEKKLDSAYENLLRLKDIMGELESRV